jgi:hypothetical protein
MTPVPLPPIAAALAIAGLAAIAWALIAVIVTWVVWP